MPPLEPDQALFLAHLFLASLRDEHKLTRKVIAAIPIDNGDYRPDGASKTALELAWHIVATEQRFLAAVADAQFDLTPSPRPESIRNSMELALWYEEMFAAKSVPLSELSSDQLMKVIDFRGVFQLPAVLYLQFVLSHSIHHRGQLSTYLRPAGGKVPAIYGESYDSAQAKNA